MNLWKDFPTSWERSRKSSTMGWIFTVLAASLKYLSAETLDVCTFETFSASCQKDEIILMTSANYGRMRVGRCIKQNEFIGCTNDVLGLVDTWCSGKSSCEFPVSELEPANKECLQALMKYIEATFSCMKVESSCSNTGHNIITNGRGHLSNQISCGSPKPHWTIRAQVGQIINMSLIDFAASDKVESFITCKYVYGYILERALGINHTICGGKHREGALYSSKTNNVEIYMEPFNVNEKSFLINFEVTGCPELKRPPNAWYKRQGSEAVIGCETSDQEWRLTCTGNTWQGRVGNCSHKQKPIMASAKQKETHLSMSSIVLMTGFVGVALVLSVVVIVIGVVYLKKYRIRQQTKHIEKTYATMGRTSQNNGNQHVNPQICAQPNNQRPDHMTSYPTRWTCATLPAGEARTDPLIELCDEKESLYNSLK